MLGYRIKRSKKKRKRSAVAPFRCLAATPFEGSLRARILPGCPSLDRRSRVAEVGFKPRTDSVPTLIHHSHVTHSHKVFTETMNSVLAVFTFLSNDLNYESDAFTASVTSVKNTQTAIVGQFDKLEELCKNCLNHETSNEFNIKELVTTDRLDSDQVFVASSGSFSFYLWLIRGTPAAAWPVLEFGKLQAYKLAADVFQMKQPTGCALNDDDKEADAMINKLKDLVNNMKKFNMELPSTRYSIKKNSKWYPEILVIFLNIYTTVSKNIQYPW
ncbi:hypothetical protein T265_09423 [Opisthorchis viverrini]|uniref:Uncharacterized protein n=1 Tax=Opisthorchis viverrini TaxID=6198 RepID=A0A074ZA83_OPIVI|nr:hypothetical protein T265_09423 [Opisthorchis viverrini]KER22502.1 hypothetical protein T265_09423 [Opisthorchis viverrini]